MTWIIILLRITHIFAGTFWVGFVLFNLGFLQPAIRATGAEGQAFMRHLTQRTRVLFTINLSATLTMLSGLILYWMLFEGRFAAALSTGFGLVLTVGSVAGIAAWTLGALVISRAISRMRATGAEIERQGTPPSAAQALVMQRMSQRLSTMGKVALIFLVTSLLAMATAQYASF